METVPQKRKRGRPRDELPADAPLQARKWLELWCFLGKPSDEAIAQRLGLLSEEGKWKHDVVRKWRTGEKAMAPSDKKLVAHEYDVPEDWWDEPGKRIEDVINKGLGKDEPRTPTSPEIPPFEQMAPLLKEAWDGYREQLQKERAFAGKGRRSHAGPENETPRPGKTPTAPPLSADRPRDESTEERGKDGKTKGP